jgi:hypothetical protein
MGSPYSTASFSAKLGSAVLSNFGEGEQMKVTRVGLDLAKAVFQVHGVDAQGRTVVRERLKRARLLAYFAELPACLIGMEASGGAH